MDQRMHGNSFAQGGNTNLPRDKASLDLALPITLEQLKTAHHRIAAESREARERVGGEFRVGQPGICEYPQRPPRRTSPQRR